MSPICGVVSGSGWRYEHYRLFNVERGALVGGASPGFKSSMQRWRLELLTSFFHGVSLRSSEYMLVG